MSTTTADREEARKQVQSVSEAQHDADRVGHRRRLRARLLHSGRGGLHEYELLEVLLCSVLPRRDVRSLARRMIEHYDGLGRLFSADCRHMSSFFGIGEATAATIKCVGEIMDRICRAEITGKSVLDNWAKLADYLRMSIGQGQVECCQILYLDKKFRLIRSEFYENGTVDRVVLHIREVIKRALDLGASNLILSHNHPSDDTTPSEMDIGITLQLQRACSAVGLKLIDHVIVSRGDVLSMVKSGLFKP